MAEFIKSDLRASALTVDYSEMNDKGNEKADQKAKELFNKYGCFLAKGILDEATLEPSRQMVRSAIAMRFDELGLSRNLLSDALGCFDDGFQQLAKLDDMNRVAIASVLMRGLPMQQLGCDRRFERLSRLLMNTNTIIASDLGALQVHLPGKERHLCPWHQDYPSVRDSEDAIIYWIPLRTLEAPDCGLRIAPGSHTLGVLQMRGFRPFSPGGETPMRIADLSALDRFPHVTMPATSGDVLVFSTLLLHASASNTTDKVRWTVQIRHGNFEHRGSLARNWPVTCSHTRFGPFQETHPEFYLETLDCDAP